VSLRSAVLDAGYRAVVRPALFRSQGGDPELIHESLIALLGGLNPAARAMLRLLSGRPTSPVTVAGVRFPGRVGVAAGLDKDARTVEAWSALGFGFAELGTVTALAQPGNDKPRLYRLRDSRAIINRMGFNNPGAKAMADRLYGLGVQRGELTCGIPLGISLGKSKVTPVADAVPDYVASLRMLAPYADYIAINVSSPNTPGLRSLQEGRPAAGPAELADARGVADHPSARTRTHVREDRTRHVRCAARPPPRRRRRQRGERHHRDKHDARP